MLPRFSNRFGFKQLRMVLYSVLVLLAGLLITLDFRNARSEDKTESSYHWPKLNPVSISDDWVEAGNDTDSSEDSGSMANASYQRFKPMPEKKEEIPPPTPIEKPSIVAAPSNTPEKPLPPLIIFEAEQPAKKEEDSKAIETLHFPVGTLIYARILTPVYSRTNKGNQAIYAELIKPLVLDGRTLLPATTRLMGKIERINDAHASFSESWEVLLDYNERKSLNARLQESDYDERTGRYGLFDGAIGLRMKRLNIDIEPEIYKVEELVEEVVKPLAVKRAQSDILSELKLPSLDDPWTLDVSETVEPEEGVPDEYYIPAGTLFYLWVM